MTAYIPIIVIAVFAISAYVLAGFLLHGKGAFLIAGYNTMSKKEQIRYDKQKRCRSTDFTVLTTAIALTMPILLILLTEIYAILPEKFLIAGIWIFSGVILTADICGMIYSNTKAKK